MSVRSGVCRGTAARFSSIKKRGKSSAQLRADAGVALGRLGIFLIRFGMKGACFHRPTIRPMRAETASPSTACTVPFSISATRRRASCLEASSLSGSTVCNSSVRRSTNSPTFAGGQWRASSTICSSVIGTSRTIRCSGFGFNHRVSRPFGTKSHARPNPTLKRWAIVACPSGTTRLWGSGISETHWPQAD